MSPRSMWARLEEDRIIFSQFIKNIKTTQFIIVYIDEWSYNSSTLPLYILMKKGEDWTWLKTQMQNFVILKHNKIAMFTLWLKIKY